MEETPIVYIVEDDEANRKSLADLLEAFGFSVVAFPTGEDFLEKVEPAASSCAVIDVNLPGVSGLEVVSEMRRRGLAVPAIVVSGRATSQMRQCATALGALAFLEKPIDIDRLISIFDTVLK